MDAPLEKQPRRFHDGGLPALGDFEAIPPDPDRDPRIVLERLSVEGEEQFALLRRIGYLDRVFGEILVPADIETFRTDLTSVPTIFTWLVPRTGAHLPAALLHDGLLHDPAEAPTYLADRPINRVQADRVFRDAMADTGTGLVRRWLVWSAVTTATMVKGVDTGFSRFTTWRHRIAVVVTLLLVATLGVLATLDLFDLAGIALPWMGDRPWWAELLGGLAGAVVIPACLALLWGRFRSAGFVMAIGLAVLLHVTAGVLLVTGLYLAAEKVAGLVTRRS
ncbi:hypothetical protein BJ980_001355 [Nocardioides daedukensis]|uniref:DUF1353 domain-containing protein n=1 Tax=Nocardioides daedukensis TaxID=634462 RepID=A0A7Y9RXE3_9ACTN|nr:hypothetical protein [Nocardioides daedukensis]